MKIEEICLYQFLERKAPNDKGDCKKCISDEYNKKCVNYIPIVMGIIGVKDEMS